jgi:hypothetical protein
MAPVGQELQLVAREVVDDEPGLLVGADHEAELALPSDAPRSRCRRRRSPTEATGAVSTTALTVFCAAAEAAERNRTRAENEKTS